MRSFSASNTNENHIIPDTVATAVISSAGAIVAQDYPSGAALIEIDSQAALFINFVSTYATVPTTTQSATTATSQLNMYQATGHQHIYKIPSSSTGYSLAGVSSGVATIIFWSL